MIALILNGPLPEPIEGRGTRLHALRSYLDGFGVDFRVLTVPRRRLPRNRLGFLFAAIMHGVAGMRELDRMRPEWVVMSHPDMPLFATPSRLDVWLTSRFLTRLSAGVTGWRPGIILDLRDVRSFQLKSFYPEIQPGVLQRYRELETVSFRMADWILAPPGGWLKVLPETYAIDANKLVPLPNGGVAPPPEASPAFEKQGFTLVYAGALMREGRGVEEMLLAFVKTKRQDLRLLLVGPGGEWLREYEREDPRIRWLGAVSDVECAAILAACDMGLYPYPNVQYLQLTHTTSKFAAYVLASLPILATWNPTIATVLGDLDIGLACSWNELPAVMERLPDRKDDIVRWRKSLVAMGSSYEWNNVFGKAFASIPGFPCAVDRGADRELLRMCRTS